MNILDNIKSPADVKKLSESECTELASEIRKRLVDVVSKNGGHLASNLGVVELTIALHRVFSSPKDTIIWDVGHQSYVHKMLTGRNKDMETLRKYNGLCGFTKRSESEHDPFGAGHSGTSISAAAGIATANRILDKKGHTIALVGDGAFAGGMIYEALNDCAERKLNLIVVLNENEMSISKNVGGMSKYLSKIKTSERYYN
ncbi:MAG: hypothetical protein IJS94_02775 [Clostridia bacterium]|nr:hypothetical protein [Clostridia bacterium]